MDRLTIPEAARRLGISEGAARKRYERGTLEGERGDDGRVYVWVDTGQTNRPDELVGILRSQVEMLRAELDEAHAANRENRRIIAALTARIPEIEAPASPERPSEAPESAAAGSASDVPQEGERSGERPWWRRVFGG